MCTFSDYLSVIEHQNLLRMENCTDSLCHNDHGAVFDILRQCFSKRRIRFQVKCRKAVIENKDFQIKQGIETLQSVSGRFHIIETGRYTVVDDCYNANPVSMKASLDVLKEAKGRKVAVLGDMGELGTDEAALHAEVGTHAGTCGIDALYCAGPLCEHLAKAAKEADPKLEVRHFADRESLMAELPKLLQDGDQILVKASHFMEYGKIVEMLSAEK